MVACDDAGTAAPVTRLVYDKFEEAQEKYGGNKSELHVVKLKGDAAGVSLRLDGDWTPHWKNNVTAQVTLSKAFTLIRVNEHFLTISKEFFSKDTLIILQQISKIYV